jgi:hypothetical protein
MYKCTHTDEFLCIVVLVSSPQGAGMVGALVAQMDHRIFDNIARS